MHFEPGFPFTLEGLFYAFIGLVVAILLIGLVKKVYASFQSSQKKKKDLYHPSPKKLR